MIDGITPKKPTSHAQKTTEPTFRTPEEVAKNETPINASKPDSKPNFAGKVAKDKKKTLRQRFNGLSRPKKILTVVLLLAFVGGALGGIYTLTNKKPKVAPVVQVEEKKEAPKAVPIYSPLSGLAVTKEQSELPVTGVMIENSPDARPQAGLNQAGVVFEAIAEGGITRFLALYQENQPDYIGPIRSVRPYYLDWLQGFDAAVAHVGGSSEALAKIRREGIKDLDQGANPGPYHRINSRYAPHNMYSSLKGLLDLQRSKKFTSNFTGFTRKAEAPSETPSATNIDVVISGALYNIHYDYNAKTNSYNRVLAGRPHVDDRSKAQLSPKVVIAMVTAYSIHPNGVHSIYKTIGSGKVFVFQDGTVTQGTWEKTSAKSQIVLKDTAGKVLPLNAGQTWITATSSAGNVQYKP